jgi:alpha-galactosidase
MTSVLRGLYRKGSRGHYACPVAVIAAIAALSFLATAILHGQVNGEGHRPYLGWTSWSEQTIDGSFLTQVNIMAQSDALMSSGLQRHGYQYITIDSGWQGDFDANGRPIPNPAAFPDIKALIDHIHRNGQKAGIYWIPGVEYPAVAANSPILGTPYHIQDILVVPYTAGNAFGGSGTSPYHYKIDFTKPGAQEYINSVVALFAAWGVDLIKLDGVTPGSYHYDLSIDNTPDVAAWSKAIGLSGRPIWLTVSWALDADYLDVWQQYSNAWRIDDDIECEGRCATLTNWNRIYQRFRDLPAWQNAAGPALGWNDLDALDIPDGAGDGLNSTEKQTAISIWALANAPLYLGGDLTKMDGVAKQLAGNDEIIAIQQSGKPAKQLLGGEQPVWVSSLGGNTYYVGLFNLNATPAVVHLPWNLLGRAGAAKVRDLWRHSDLGPSAGSFTTAIPGHGAVVLKVIAYGQTRVSPSASYEAESAVLGGSASIGQCPTCSDGEKVGNLGLGSNDTVTFNNVYVPRSGNYLMQVDSMTIGLRSFLYTVNGGAFQTLNSGGESFNRPASTTVVVPLKKGMNSIQFGSPFSYPPDLDRIVISGDGDLPAPSFSVYEAETASLSGSATAVFSNYSSGLAKAGNLGAGPANSVTFPTVTVPRDGAYLLEVDYLTSGPRSFYLTVNDQTPQQINLTGSTFDEPASTVLRVSLHAGTNTLTFGNPSDYAPDLDRIVIAPTWK